MVQQNPDCRETLSIHMNYKYELVYINLSAIFHMKREKSTEREPLTSKLHPDSAPILRKVSFLIIILLSVPGAGKLSETCMQ